ncbi:GntR family transcriptional regulator [Nesterenkonia sp. PF2B19]|uniref:GntR family transcriptional regulator n=1 Tax=Nesterenkonia sp. PF2B19 TaxID=1881858 RepID=UPI000A19E76A|nr:GntR family transcriptional regulator [Nesterenkonia sp. PF2B19]OSM44486.1 hypothetical protein BCY76_001975 [Nesterenkonia sp. PF2B19]
MATLADDLLGLIASGEYSGGQWLREGVLAERLGVSRTPVRDALRELAALSVVELVPHRAPGSESTASPTSSRSTAPGHGWSPPSWPTPSRGWSVDTWSS